MGTAKGENLFQKNYGILRELRVIAFEPRAIPSTPQPQLAEWKFYSMCKWPERQGSHCPISLSRDTVGFWHPLSPWAFGCRIFLPGDCDKEKESSLVGFISIQVQWTDNTTRGSPLALTHRVENSQWERQLEKIRGITPKEVGHSCLWLQSLAQQSTQGRSRL